MIKSKKGQSIGLIGGLIFGIASLVVGIIIAFVVVSTLTDADLLTADRTTTTVLNEVGHVNTTGYTLAGASVSDAIDGTYTITGLVNYTSGDAVLVANATTSNAGIVTNSSETNYNNATFNYTYNVYGGSEYSASLLSGNFTEGVDNVSSKIPTVLLIAAIVLILGVLALLVGVWQRMSLGAGI